MNLSWHEFLVLVRRWQVLPGNALAESLAGHAVWSATDQLLAHLVDSVVYGNWLLARVNNGKGPKPQPIPRPWDKKPQSFGKGAIPIDQIDAWIEGTIRED